MKKIRIDSILKSHYFELPEKWEEVNKQMLTRLAPLLLEQYFSKNVLRLRLLLAASGMTKREFFSILPSADPTVELENADAMSGLLKEIEFLETLSFNNDLIGSKGLFPFLLKSPGNNLHRLSFDQWLLAGILTQHYFSDKSTAKEKKQILRKLFSALYTPWFMPWCEWIMPMAYYFSFFYSSDALIAILINFLGLKANIVKNHPHLFESKGKNKNPNFNELITDLAGDKFGEADKVGRKQAVLIISYLNKAIREQEKAN